MEYIYLKDPDKLALVLKTLASHEAEINSYYLSHLSPRVIQPDSDKEKLVVLFAIANRQRRGVDKGNKKLIGAVTSFYKGIDQKVEECKVDDPQKAHQLFLEWLCNIGGMDQKTANLFLKWLVMFHHDFKLGLLDWGSWKPYLHVPLDVWVKKLIGKDYLGVCTENYEHDFLKAKEKPECKILGSKKERYDQLQEEFAEVASLARESRISLDVLWFIGHMYCIYHPLMCRICWIGRECQHCASLDLRSVPTKSKSERRKERQEERKRENESMRQYMREHPEEVEKIKNKLGSDRIYP